MSNISNEKDTLSSVTPRTHNPTLFVKRGATDLRRGPNALAEVVKVSMGGDLAKGNMFAFANTPKTNVKMIQKTENGLVQNQIQLNQAILLWPPHKANSRPFIRLTSSEKDTFLEAIFSDRAQPSKKTE